MISAIFTPVCSLSDTPDNFNNPSPAYVAQATPTFALRSLQAEICFFLSSLPLSTTVQLLLNTLRIRAGQGRAGRIVVGIKSGLSEVSGSKLGFNSSRSEEENCLSEKAFLVNSIQFQPRWNLTAKQVIKCKVSTRTLKIPTMEMWSFMSIFGIHYGNNSVGVRERRGEERGVVRLLASHL